VRPFGGGLARHLGVLYVAGTLERAPDSGEGFSFIAVEDDWPDCYEVNRYMKGYRDSGINAHEVLRVFERWPTWMWANEEIAELAEWFRQHNDGLPQEERVGFYGLDVYSLRESMEAVIGYLERVDPEAVPTA
jgi:erythromycin esterase